MTPGGKSRPSDSAWPAELVRALADLPESPRLWVAYSGGLDSTLLLHGLCHSLPAERRARLHAIHINHQLQANAAACESFCRRVCQAQEIPLTRGSRRGFAGAGWGRP